MQQDWTGKIVIVTGGGGGMGQAAAKRFAKAGARVFVFGRTLASLVEACDGETNIVPVVCDVADRESVTQAVTEVSKAGTPFALVHTAGINTADRFMAHSDPGKIASPETWERVLDINIMGVVNMMNAVTPLMAAAGGGRIVVVSSTAGHGYDSFAGVPYTASKWAVHGLLFTARQQLNAQGIVVSEYAPGESNTPIVDKRPVLPTAEHRQAMIRAEECGEALFFMASLPHSMSLIHMPIYQPFGGMPPQINSPWIPGMEIRPKS
jgi:NAD(P)-dependent dehydrogenase (short-subunit alcohol dehydrogenase family)